MKRTVMIGLLLISVSALAFPGPGPRDDMRMALEGLNLTSKQKAELKTIRKEARDERIKLMDQMDDLRDKTDERVMAVLTDEQKKTLQAKRAEMMKQRKAPQQGCDRMPPQNGDQMPERGKMMPMQ